MRTERFEKRGASLLAIAIVMVVALVTPVSAAGTLVADYRFENTLAPSVGTAPALQEFSRLGTSASYVSDTVFGTTRTVWDYPESHGLVFNNANSYIGTTYSIAMIVKLNAIDGYNKLIDFRHSSDRDSGLYNLDSNLNAYGCGGALSGSNPVSSGIYQQIVMTRDTAKKVRLYVDGAQVASSDDTTDGCSLGAGNAIHFLVDDDYNCSATQTNCEETGGRIARLRIWNGALTPGEVAGLDTVPGANTPPPGGTVHNRTVSLTLKKHVIASGTVAVTDGYTECAQAVTVVIKRKTPSGFKAVGSAVTSLSGTYRKKVADKPGTYQASVVASSAGGNETCGAALSPTRRHRH